MIFPFSRNPSLNDIEEIICYNLDVDGINCGPWFQDWRLRKSRFSATFPGPSLIYRYPKPITINTPEVYRENEVYSFASYVSEKLGRDAFSFVLANLHSFYSNKVEFPYPHYSIKKGERLLHALRKFSPDNESAVREVQDKGSTYIQQSKIHGHLYFSIHPLDFLSMSETASHWRSCHSLQGSYRTGPANMMVDDSTIIAYLLTDNEPKELPNFPASIKWNDKKWRVLIHMNENAVYISKEYPFHNETLRSTVSSVLSDNFDRIFPTEFSGKSEKKLNFEQVHYCKDPQTHLSSIKINNVFYPTCEVFQYNPYYMGYKDLFYQDPEIPISAAYRKPTSELLLRDLQVSIGAPVTDPVDPSVILMNSSDFQNKYY